MKGAGNVQPRTVASGRRAGVFVTARQGDSGYCLFLSPRGGGVLKGLFGAGGIKWTTSPEDSQP